MGVSAMISEPTHIMPTDTISDSRRPCRSAICPNSQPPSGRTMKPAANSVAALSCWTTGSCEGKKAGAKYSAKAV